MKPRTAKTLREIIDAAMRGDRDEAIAHKLHGLGQEVVALAAISMCRRIAELENKGGKPSPSTPSGMVPVYTKPNASKRRKKPGARNGHDGARRKRSTSDMSSVLS